MEMLVNGKLQLASGGNNDRGHLLLHHPQLMHGRGLVCTVETASLVRLIRVSGPGGFPTIAPPSVRDCPSESTRVPALTHWSPDGVEMIRSTGGYP